MRKNLEIKPSEVLVKKSLDDLLKRIKKSRFGGKVIEISPRLSELSKPKKSSEDSEDQIGPGSYEPKDGFLSTKSNSKNIMIGRSLRFKVSMPPLKSTYSTNVSPSSLNMSSVIEPSKSPSYTFKRTGHNLKLVGNPDFPGVGKYTPNAELHKISYTFNRSKREFNWKKRKHYIVNSLKSQIDRFRDIE